MDGKMAILNGLYPHVNPYFIKLVISLFWILTYFATIVGKILWIGRIDLIKAFVLMIILIANFVALIIFYRQNPNISSNGLPLLDE